MQNKTIYDYNDSFAIYYKWQIISTFVLVAVAFMLGGILGVVGIADSTALNIAIIAAVIFWAWAMIIGIIKMARAWPTGEVTGFWSGVKVTMLNFALLGFRHHSIKQLPWKAVITWGIGAMLLSPSMVQYIISGDIKTYVLIGGLFILLMPIIIIMMWGTGKVSGLIWNKEAQYA